MLSLRIAQFYFVDICLYDQVLPGFHLSQSVQAAGDVTYQVVGNYTVWCCYKVITHWGCQQTIADNFETNGKPGAVFFAM